MRFYCSFFSVRSTIQGFLLDGVSGCEQPDIHFNLDTGSLLDDGRIPVNISITYECSDDRVFHASCKDSNNGSANGVWEQPIHCPPIKGKYVLIISYNLRIIIT